MRNTRTTQDNSSPKFIPTAIIAIAIFLLLFIANSADRFGAVDGCRSYTPAAVSKFNPARAGYDIPISLTAGGSAIPPLHRVASKYPRPGGLNDIDPSESRQPLGMANVSSLPAVNPEWLDELLDKILIVESSSRQSPPPGDNGRAVGPYQIHKIAVDDVNQMWGSEFRYTDRSDAKKARQIAGLYITGCMRIHRAEIAARIYNGGPRGWKKSSTDIYRKKIQEAGK